jgi:hypothetical protein
MIIILLLVALVTLILSIRLVAIVLVLWSRLNMLKCLLRRRWHIELLRLKLLLWLWWPLVLLVLVATSSIVIGLRIEIVTFVRLIKPLLSLLRLKILLLSLRQELFPWLLLNRGLSWHESWSSSHLLSLWLEFSHVGVESHRLRCTCRV